MSLADKILELANPATTSPDQLWSSSDWELDYISDGSGKIEIPVLRLSNLLMIGRTSESYLKYHLAPPEAEFKYHVLGIGLGFDYQRTVEDCLDLARKDIAFEDPPKWMIDVVAAGEPKKVKESYVKPYSDDPFRIPDESFSSEEHKELGWALSDFSPAMQDKIIRTEQQYLESSVELESVLDDIKHIFRLCGFNLRNVDWYLDSFTYEATYDPHKVEPQKLGDWAPAGGSISNLEINSIADKLGKLAKQYPEVSFEVIKKKKRAELSFVDTDSDAYFPEYEYEFLVDRISDWADDLLTAEYHYQISADFAKEHIESRDARFDENGTELM